jgi:hypothetical protein
LIADTKRRTEILNYIGRSSIIHHWLASQKLGDERIHARGEASARERVADGTALPAVVALGK